MEHSVAKTIQKKLSQLVLKTNIVKPHLLLAVSGGADSIAMLDAVVKCNKKKGYKISVITINHNIREKTETAGDAKFVYDFCEILNTKNSNQINKKIECSIIELEKNEVHNTAKIRKKGIEEAARFLRYKEFTKLAKKIKADYILTAHNKNDYYETILMRIFQGANPESIFGIAEIREMFFRPMLTITRSEIENYLNLNNLKWREDSSNLDQFFLRNKIRHNLIPALNICFDGWQQGLDKTIEKINIQNKFIYFEYKKKTKNHNWKLITNENNLTLECDFIFFMSLDPVFKLKFIQAGINILNSYKKNKNEYGKNVAIKEKTTDLRKRIPYSVFKDFLKISEKNAIIFSNCFCLKKEGAKLNFFISKKTSKNKNIKSYFFWVEEEKKIQTPAGTFLIRKENNKFFIKHKNENSKELGPFTVPCCVRSKVMGDLIKMANGKNKTIKKIINEWKLTEKQKHLLPVIEEKGIIKAIYGSIFGKNDWVVLTN